MYKLAKEPNDLEKFFVERANTGDVEGLVALYEPNAVIIPDSGKQVAGTDGIREFFVSFLKSRPQLATSIQAPAVISGNVALTSSQHNNGDISAEVARRQPDGHWLWSIDQFALAKEA